MTTNHDDHAQIEIPPTAALLWQRRTAPTRGPKPGMSVELVVAAAVAVADRDGLAAVSMGRVAKELGYTTMSIYRYVSSKDDLLALMYDETLGPAPEIDAADGWRPGLERWARHAMAGYQRHPWLLQMPITGPPLGPNTLTWLEQGLRAMSGTALHPQAKANVVLLISGYVSTTARLFTDLAGAAPPAGSPTYGALLRALADRERYPEVLAAADSGIFDDGDEFGEADFEFGLQRTLDGIASLVDATPELTTDQ
jgi:AcrR family transcriptional regulator